MHGVRIFIEPVFYRGRDGQESEEGKEDREGSHQEGGKEDFQEKEVTVSTTDKLPLPGRNLDASDNSLKDLKCPLQPSSIAARHDKAGPLCRLLLHKGPFFRSAGTTLRAGLGLSPRLSHCHEATAQRERPATQWRDRTRSPAPVSRKREYSG